MDSQGENGGASLRVPIELHPLGISLSAEPGAPLRDLLSEYGVEFPCGGTSRCGACRVQLLKGAAPVTPEDRSALSTEELNAGWRLACHLRAHEPLCLQVEQWNVSILTDDSQVQRHTRSGLGIAIDLGTTTLVAQLLDLATGKLLGLLCCLNPQAAYGADVMSRVQFALKDRLLTDLIRRALGEMVSELAGPRTREVIEVAIVGNTVMHHLFCGHDVEALSGTPFETPFGAEVILRSAELGWNLPESTTVRVLPCIGGFVGSDILAGIAAVDLRAGGELRALVDLGTNGEIAVGNNDRVLCASTAAGCAFEAGSIRMGMRASTGAIAHVETDDSGAVRCHVIGNVEPRGICGSGVVDAVAVGLDSNAILHSGRLANGVSQFPLAGSVSLVQSDIRELQLAKGAIACGLQILLEHWGATADDLKAVYLAGAFGNYVSPRSAERIGLLEVPSDRVSPAGNTALRGAKMLLGTDCASLLRGIEHVSLAADPLFQERFAACMSFPAPNSGARVQTTGR